MSTAVSLGDIERSTAHLPLIGYTAFWRLAGIRVQHTDLAAAVAAAGFPEFFPEPPSPRKALRRAIEAWLSSRALGGTGAPVGVADESDGEDNELSATSSRVQERALVRSITDKEWLVFAIVAEAVDLTALGLSYGTHVRVLYHKASGGVAITSEAEGAPALKVDAQSRWLTDEFLPYWQQYRTLHFSGDLSRMMRQIIGAMRSVSLRPNGGLYFVPVSQADALQRLSTLIESLPVAGDRIPFICAQGVLNRPEAVRRFSNALYEGLVDELNVLASDLARLTAGRAGSVKATTIAARLASYRQVREKVELFTDVLSRRTEHLLERLETLTTQARAILIGDALAEEGEEQASGETDEATPLENGAREQGRADELVS